MLKKLKKIINFANKPKENYANLYLFKYHLLKAVKKIFWKQKYAENNKNFQGDMFNWPLYNLHYRGELKKDAKLYTLNLKPGDYQFIDNKLLKINTKIKPLHENWQLIYETILQLKPLSILELGCGNGMHLNNLQTLSPEFKLFGIDREAEQIKFLRESFPQLQADIRVADATKLFNNGYLEADLSFTQAVIMHIHTGTNHLTALTNVFNASKKFVILMERWKNHHFMNDIKMLHQEKKIKWDNLYFYYRTSSVTKKPHIIICSNQLLDYTILNDYNIMPKI